MKTNKKVMIVDDNKEFLDELKETLALSGYDLVAVDDPLEAVNKAKETRPAVIIVDLKMPKKSGFELAYELRHCSEIKDVPVIAMSGFFKDEDSHLLKLCGIIRLLKKPFYPLDVISEIEEALSDKRRDMSGDLRDLEN